VKLFVSTALKDRPTDRLTI